MARRVLGKWDGKQTKFFVPGDIISSQYWKRYQVAICAYGVLTRMFLEYIFWVEHFNTD